MEQLPTTSIGLIAFIIVAAGVALRYLADQNRKTTETFMTYIQTKNHNLERATQLFTKTMEEQAERHREAMVNQNDRHKQMLDDMAARLENVFPINKRKRV